MPVNGAELFVRQAGTPYTDHDDLAGLLHALGIERAAVRGCSNGGGIALDFALVHPEMGSALMLSGSGLRGFTWSEAIRTGWRERTISRT